MLQKVSNRVADGEDAHGAWVGLGSLARGLSIEINPRDTIKHADWLRRLPKGTKVFVTRLPKGTADETLAACVALYEMELTPVPHVTARTSGSLAELARHLTALKQLAGVTDILFIAGTVAPIGLFTDTLPILASDVLVDAGLARIFVAGHPEGHPDADDAALDRAILAKNEFAARSGLAVEIVTQFFFDAGPIIAWEKRLRTAGNRLPIHAGLHGVAGITSLMKHAVNCGVGASMKVLASRASNLLQLATMQAPDQLVADLARAIVADPASLFSHVHLFPLGGLERTIGWANAVVAGRIQLTNGALRIEI